MNFGDKDIIREYVTNGGQLFSIVEIDTYRDGGTKLLKTTKDPFYINSNGLTFHTAYPPEESNKITDPKLIAFLIDRMERYIEDQQIYLNSQQNLINKLKGLNSF